MSAQNNVDRLFAVNLALTRRCAQLEAALGAMIAMHESGVVSLGTLRMARAALASATDSKAGQS